MRKKDGGVLGCAVSPRGSILFVGTTHNSEQLFQNVDNVCSHSTAGIKVTNVTL